MLKSIALGLGTLGLVMLAANPSITEKNETFTITFDKGAVWACTVYRMTEPTETPSPNFPDGIYAPRKCGSLDPKATSYQDNWTYILKYDKDWDVYAEIAYPKGENDVTYSESNRVRVHR